MRIVIHQPYFFPWLGYFSKLQWADSIVILDNVNFRKRHYQDRAKIINMHGESDWISLPTGEGMHLKIDKITVKNVQGAHQIIARTLNYSYAKSSHFREEWTYVEELLSCLLRSERLIDINISIIKSLIDRFFPNGNKAIYMSSTLSNASCPTQRIIDIAKSVGADEILVGSGSSSLSNVHNLNVISRSGLQVYEQDYLGKNIKYRQARRKDVGFISGLSCLDALFNIGSDEIIGILSDPVLKPEKLGG